MVALAPCVGVMLISGCMNTLLMKFMVMQQVPTSFGAKGVGFDHPYFQSLLMMIGEFLCLIAYYLSTSKKEVEKSKAVPNYIFMVACLLDWTATTLVNMAYVIIPASIVQMTRGSIVIFTCILSVTFLGRRQLRSHIAGVVLVFLGISLVSLSAFFNPAAASEQGPSASMKMFGLSLCIIAQVFQAFMLVWEEKIMSKYTVQPLQVVGMEGTFGFLFGIVLLVFLNRFHIESSSEAIYQMTHSVPLAAAVFGSIFSVAFFNFAGVSVTQQASATARSTIDVSRTILIWGIELALRWNTFNMLELCGFVVLAAGTLIYNRLIVIPGLEEKEALPILAEKTAVKASGACADNDVMLL